MISVHNALFSVRCVVADSAELMSDILWPTVLNFCQMSALDRHTVRPVTES